IGEYNRALLTSSKYIGGIYHVRDHVGDPHGRPPYTVVPAAKQHEALEFLRTYAFSEKSFQLPPGLVNKLAIERLQGLDFFSSFFGTQRIDYPWHDLVLALQRNVLNRLFHPVLLNRVLDNELRFAPGEKPFLMADLFHGLDSAIWSELDANPGKISSLRRNLQREHLKQLIRLVLRPAPPMAGPGPVGFVLPIPPTPRPPEDATTLARASLLSIQARIKQALAAGKVTDATTKAHLEETQSRITATLQAQMQKPAE
ncbi:MAG TPA: zinc-dependent metalloprotease, partial [Candidatus Acidoferrales bacterium]|nr:zinc-dependent metalloprotease [Candidatus Acidoferrales bacterium]